MRYTTIIDITEFPQLYKSASIRLVYLHLVLRSGYHDDDRDLISTSIRRIARETGLTIAAVRHALAQLEKFQLLEHQGPLLKVRKFVLERPITARARNKTEEKKQRALSIEEEERQRRHQEQREREEMTKNLFAIGKTSFMVYYEQQQDLARQGDPNAIAFVNARDNKETYLAHSKMFKK